MEQHFNSKKYISHLADELIRNFNYSSSATTPVLVGNSREKEIIRKLEMLLPKTISVGSGCVIDSFGNTSKQMDIILYEKNFCPVFCINESSETTYYPCEAVIAVGEVKSSLNNKELKDIFSKSNSIKKLKRYSPPLETSFGIAHSFRYFGTNMYADGVPSEGFNPIKNSYDQIFFFALCGKVELSDITLQNKLLSLLKEANYINEVNLISILNYGIITYFDKVKNKTVDIVKDANSILISKKDNSNFEYLLKKLRTVIEDNRTVPTHTLNRYFNLDLDTDKALDDIIVELK